MIYHTPHFIEFVLGNIAGFPIGDANFWQDGVWGSSTGNNIWQFNQWGVPA